MFFVSPSSFHHTISSFFLQFLWLPLILLADSCSMTFPYNISVTQGCISDISGFSWSFDSLLWFNVHFHTSAHTCPSPSNLQLPQNIHTCFSKLSSHACCHRLSIIFPSKVPLLLHSMSVNSLLPEPEKVIFDSLLSHPSIQSSNPAMSTSAKTSRVCPSFLFSLFHPWCRSPPTSLGHCCNKGTCFLQELYPIHSPYYYASSCWKQSCDHISPFLKLTSGSSLLIKYTVNIGWISRPFTAAPKHIFSSFLIMPLVPSHSSLFVAQTHHPHFTPA